MTMQSIQQSIEASYFIIVLIKNDYIPSFPPLLALTEEPILHDQIAIQPEITARFELPSRTSISTEFVVSTIALPQTLARQSTTTEETTS